MSRSEINELKALRKALFGNFIIKNHLKQIK